MTTRREIALRAGRIGVETRKRRAELKAALKSGDVDPIALLRGDYEEWEPVIARWRLEQLLPAVPGVGSAIMHEIMVAGPFAPTQRMSSLRPQRRHRLAETTAELRFGPHGT